MIILGKAMEVCEYFWFLLCRRILILYICTGVRNAWSYTSTPQYVFMAWCLIKQ